MINDDIKQIVEAELQLGEELLWAGHVSNAARDKWIQKSINESRLGAIPSLAIGTVIIWKAVTGVINRHPEAELWLTLLFSLPLFTIGALVLFAAYESFKVFYKVEDYKQKRPFKFYALTNKHLLYFNNFDQCILSLDAQVLRKIDIVKQWKFPNKWIPKYMLLSPVGEGIWKFAELYFLADFEMSKIQIQNALRKGTSS